MKCYAFDVDREYYFCGASKEECENILIPFLNSRRKEDESFRYDRLFCSSISWLEECLEKQKHIKYEDKYNSLTMRFIYMFNCFCDDDVYFAINKK